jgi:hypothetical protein
MKPLKYLLFILLLASCAENKGVYICTGYKSKCYHKKENCKGLDRCSGQILNVTIEDARKIGRNPCCYCY